MFNLTEAILEEMGHPQMGGMRSGMRLANVKAVGGVSADSSSLKTNLIAYYVMDGTGDFLDSHGLKTIAEQGTVTEVAGKIGNARHFNGSAGTYGLRSDDIDFSPGSSSFFITMWTKPASLSKGTYPAMFSKFQTSGNLKEWHIYFNDASNSVDIGVSSSGSNDIVVNGVVPLTTTAFHFIAAGWDAIAGKLRLSMNGASFIETDFVGPMFDGTAPVRFATRDGATALYEGAIDEVAFWKGRCLTLADVQQIYNGGNGLAYISWT